jgi:translation initiation factor eIF-2B subunit delta
MPWQALVERLWADNTSGAAEIAKQAVEAIYQWLEDMRSVDFDRWRAAYITFGRRLCAAQPAMAPLFHLVNDAMLAIESCSTVATAELRVRDAAQTFLQQLDQAQGQLCAAAWPILAQLPKILTFSYSSSVLAVLQEARGRHLPLQVFCTEGRPMLEGRHMAQQLAAAGITVTFGIDAALPAFVARASLVLIGADSISRDGVINKIGTSSVALAARAAGVPCYVLASRQKWLPFVPMEVGVSEQKPAQEVWSDPPVGVSVWNAYFERTPLDLFSGFFHEGGLLAPGELAMELSGIPVAPALRPS